MSMSAVALGCRFSHLSCLCRILVLRFLCSSLWFRDLFLEALALPLPYLNQLEANYGLIDDLSLSLTLQLP